MPSRLRLFSLLCAALLTRHHQALVEFLLTENAILRELARPELRRPSVAHKRAFGEAARRLGRRALRSLDTTFHPDTMLRWYRELVAAKYSARAETGKTGRPRVVRERVQALVLRFARENAGWGYTHIRDALAHVGHHVGRSTIARILHEHGLEPAPLRGRRMSWSTFLKLHWGAIAAMDFFTVEVLTVRGLVRYFALIVIDLKTRRIELAGVTCAPSGEWMLRVARNLTDAIDGFLLGKRKLILDRDPLYTADFRAFLKRSGTQVIRLPAESPNLNAYAERAIRSIREECLSKVIPLGEAHVRAVLREYLTHYHAERHHQGLGGQLIEGEPPSAIGKIRRRQRLGGLLNHYFRDAA